MKEYYLVKNKKGLYLCDGEDSIGVDYDELGELTLAFIDKESAKFNANKEDEIVKMSISESAEDYFFIV